MSNTYFLECSSNNQVIWKVFDVWILPEVDHLLSPISGGTHTICTTLKMPGCLLPNQNEWPWHHFEKRCLLARKTSKQNLKDFLLRSLTLALPYDKTLTHLLRNVFMTNKADLRNVFMTNKANLTTILKMRISKILMQISIKISFYLN